MKSNERLIVALDYKTVDEVKKLVSDLGDRVTTYKVGLELFLNTCGSAVDYLHSLDKKVFLDLKFHDIPNTVTMASLFAVRKEVFMFNVHASGGMAMMKSISKMLKEKKSNSIVIGVTILTSLSDEDLKTNLKTECSLEELTRHLALQTKKSGLHGVVCSPLEVSSIKKICGNDFYTICPGVRPEWAVSNDQKRVMTPEMAILNGADFLVVGRPITASQNPVQSAELILEEIEKAMKTKIQCSTSID